MFIYNRSIYNSIVNKKEENICNLCKENNRFIFQDFSSSCNFTLQDKKSRLHKKISITGKTFLLATFLSHMQVNAAQLKIDDFWIRDYLDLAQNKGQFKVGATNVQIKKKDGTYFQFPDLPIPDFSAVSNKGPTTSIGGAYTVSASHNIKPPIQHHAIYEQDWDQTKYKLVDVRNANQASPDFAVHRLNKFVVESTGITDTVNFNLSKEEALDRYGVMYNGQRMIIGFRAGSGTSEIVDKDGKYIAGSSYSSDLLSATMFSYEWNGLNANAGFTSFHNQTTGGDSGSGFFLYDNKEKKWVLLGTLYGLSNSYIRLNKVHDGTINALKSAYTQNVSLDGKSATINKKKINIDGKEVDVQTTQSQLPAYTHEFNNKDLSFSGGGTLILDENLELKAGGLIFDSNKNYVINGKDGNKNLYYKGAGIDIGANSKVSLNVETRDTLHKIGYGSLEVNVTQNNDLKIGNGSVILNAEKTFNNIYMVNNLGTVVINKDNALNTNGNDYSGIFFTRGGGTLDLNGHNQSFTKIAASDIGANIVNTSKNKSELAINHSNGNYVYHGTLQGNMDVKHELANKGTSNLILDGNVNVENINVKNASVHMQGHATTHAIFSEEGCKPGFKCYVNDFKDRENAANNKNNSHYKSNNRVSSFDQDDFENREFRFKNLYLDNSDLTQARNSVIIGDIHASNGSKVTLGTKTFYLDKYDGRNINGNGFSFRQQVEKGEAVGDSIFKGNVNLESNSSLDINSFFQGGVKATDSSVNISSKDASLTYMDLNNSKVTFTDTAEVVSNGSIKGDGTFNIKSEATFIITNEENAKRKSKVETFIKDVHVNESGSFAIVNHARVNSDVFVQGDKAKFAILNNAQLKGTLDMDSNAHGSVSDGSIIDGFVNLKNKADLLLSNNARINGDVSINDAMLTFSDNAHIDGNVNIENKGSAKFTNGASAKGVFNIGQESTIYIQNSAFVEGDINTENGTIIIGSNEKSRTYFSENSDKLLGYNAGVQGTINAKNGNLQMNNAVWIVDSDSNVQNLETKNSLITSNRKTDYKEISVNKLDANNTIFKLNTDYQQSDKLVVTDSVIGDNNTIILESDELVDKNKVMNITIASLPSGGDIEKFTVAKKVVGFTELEPITLKVESNNGVDDLVLTHYDVNPHDHTVAVANSFMETSARNFVVEMNNLHKRMGDLRNNEGQAGAFARVMKGAGTSDLGYKDKYVHAQIGYDKKLSYKDVDIYNGVTLTYTDTNLNSEGFSGSTDSIGAGVYSSMMFEKGLYLDFIAKYVKHKNKINASFADLGEQTFGNHSIYLGAEAGYTLHITDNTTITPQAEIVYGKISKSDIKWSDGKVNRELTYKSYNPLVARVGVDVAHKMQVNNNTELTLRAGTSAQFDLMKDASTTLKDEYSHVETKGQNDFRMLFNAGLDAAINKRLKFSIEYTRSAFGKYNVDNEVNATVRYTF